jgi:hypothetical protein
MRSKITGLNGMKNDMEKQELVIIVTVGVGFMHY